MAKFFCGILGCSGAFTGSVAFMGHDIMKAAAVGWGAFLLTNLESLFISKFSDTLGVEKNAGLAWAVIGRCPLAYRSLSLYRSPERLPSKLSAFRPLTGPRAARSSPRPLEGLVWDPD